VGAGNADFKRLQRNIVQRGQRDRKEKPEKVGKLHDDWGEGKMIVLDESDNEPQKGKGKK